MNTIFRFKYACLFLGIIFLLSAAACSTVALSGRRQLNLVPDDELLAVSEQQYREFLRQHQVISSGEQAQLVKRVGNRIRGAVERYFREQGKADELRGYFIFMAMAGYNPNEAVEFWQRMSAQQNRASPPAFLSTHPSDESRIRNIQAHLPEAMKYYRRS